MHDQIEENRGGLLLQEETTGMAKDKAKCEKTEGAAVEVHGKIAPWSDTDLNLNIETDDVEDAHDDEGNAPRWQLRAVQRISDGLHNLALLPSGRFDFIVILDLQQNAIKDLRPIKSLAKTLRVLNASQNEIVTIPDVDFWSHFQCLSMCFLSQNALKTWADVQGINGCAQSLLWLTLFNNPLMMYKDARTFVVHKLPYLKALDNFVITDQEFLEHNSSHKWVGNDRSSARFSAFDPHLCIAHLQNFVEFETDDVAVQYVRNTEALLAKIYADNSPSVRIQKLVRGYLSRRFHFPRFWDVRILVIRVQKHVRGFLLRQLIKRQICELVTANGESTLILASFAACSVRLSPLARQSFEKLLPIIHRWRTHFQARKRAAAIKKIRFWCQLLYQRHARRTRQLQSHHQEFWIYYSSEFENDLFSLAMRVARRDPYLMTLSTEDRLEYLKERCAQSGISILRRPNEIAREVRLARRRSPDVQYEEGEGQQQVREQRDAKSIPQSAKQRLTSLALIRGFQSDKGVENQLLVAEKRFLQQDLERIAFIQSQHRQNVAGIERNRDRRYSARSQSTMKHRSRAVLLHLNHVAHEIRQRLVVCNRNILEACVKQQQRRQHQRCNVKHFSLTKTKVRVRGHAPTLSERKRFVISSLEHSSSYPKMKVFIPWTIDMYLQMVMRLSCAVSMCSAGPGKPFAFSFEDAKRADAALLIQSAWRASRCHSRRTTRNVTSARACICIKRWWRFCTGLRRRLALLRACLMVGASINSCTLFMEANVYHALVDSWPAVQAVVMRHRCPEHHLSCQLIAKAHVRLTLTPEQLVLYTASQNERSIIQVASAPSAHVSSLKIEHWSSQRCKAYLPCWMPGTPEIEPKSTSAPTEDVTASFLVDGVQVEPTEIKRELTLGLLEPSSAEIHEPRNPFGKFLMGQRVADSATRVMNLARRLTHMKTTASWLAEPLHSVMEATPFVRLTFSSVDEARKRALLLMCKTFDLTTKTHAQMYTLEALFGFALRHHQWALSQVATKEEIEPFLDESVVWMHDEIPSRWWVQTERKLGKTRDALVKSHGASQSVSIKIKPLTGFHTQHIPPRNLETWEPVQLLQSERFIPPRIFPRLSQPELASGHGSPVPLHVIDPTLSKDAERHRGDQVQVSQVPSRPASPSAALGSSRHQKLLNRLGTLSYACIQDKQEIERQAREHLVRDLREERERAMEALIVDRRMLQREKSIDVTNIKLDIDVKLQRIRFEREREQLQARRSQEQQRHSTRHRQLTREFETSFVAQSGALMRRAARAAVASSFKADEEEQQQLTASVKLREAEALVRRQDAKSFWFARNRQEKRKMAAVQEHTSAEPPPKLRPSRGNEVSGWRQQISGSKEITKLLHIM